MSLGELIGDQMSFSCLVIWNLKSVMATEQTAAAIAPGKIQVPFSCQMNQSSKNQMLNSLAETWWCSRFSPSQCVTQTAAHKPFDVGDGPDIVELLPAVYKCGQTRSVQGLLGVLSTVRAPTTHPGVLQAGRGTWPLPGVLLQQRGHKIPRRLAHVMEVFVWEAEVQAADVDASFLRRFVQKRGNAAEHHVSQHTHAPHVRRHRHRRTTDELRCSKLRVSQQEVDVAAVNRELDRITEVDELDAGCRGVKVHHDVLRLREKQI